MAQGLSPHGNGNKKGAFSAPHSRIRHIRTPKPMANVRFFHGKTKFPTPDAPGASIPR